MALFKTRTPGKAGAAASAAVPPAQSIELIRRRARHRLIGSAVLVLLGVLGFPLLFDSQPRPVAVDIPIEIPDKAKVKPLVLGAVPSAQSVAVATEPVASAPMLTEEKEPDKPAASVAAAPEKPVAKPAAVAAVVAAAAVTAVAAVSKPAVPAKSQAASAPAPQAKPVAVEKPAAKLAAAADDGSKARDLLDGVVKPAAPAGRFVVQVGAFSDAAKLREVRHKLEKAGLKTYTQLVDVKDGQRTRVRVGPFGSQAEADKAAARVKTLNLPASVLKM
jgi:DedD protein